MPKFTLYDFIIQFLGMIILGGAIFMNPPSIKLAIFAIFVLATGPIWRMIRDK
jgi:hypothetical protein